MIDQILSVRLAPALERLRRRRMIWGALYGVLPSLVLVLAMLLYDRSVPGPHGTVFATLRLAALAGAVVFGLTGMWLGGRMRLNLRTVAHRLEEQYPELNGRLITAVEQAPAEDGSYTFLQEHLAAEAIHHSTENDWGRVVPATAMQRALVAQGVVTLSLLALWLLLPGAASTPAGGVAQAEEASGVKVTPGDVELEKGTSLVILARFVEPVPGSAELVTGESSRRPLTRSLSDPVFGATLAEVQQSFSYQVVWDGGGSPSYRVKVFEYPALQRSDVTLTFPDYTKLSARRVEDTRHTTAVEGTRLDVELALNKPVTSAVLEPVKRPGQEGAEASISLTVSADKPAAFLRGYVPLKSGRFQLVLTDAEGRRNKQPVPFSFDVVPNRVPELKLASPRGDQKPSALQEILFDGTVWDDFGVLACGLDIQTPGGETVSVPFGKDVPGKEKRAFQQLLRMEELKAVPDQLFAWHTWAEDVGPDGKVRRTKGDLYFAEIRDFEQIFRQGEEMQSSQQQQQQQQENAQGQQGQAAQLVKLQKQIITATWKLSQRSAAENPDKLKEDLKVVQDSQADAQKQAEGAAEESATSPATAALWQAALREMAQSLEKLQRAVESPAETAAALTPEQQAYQSLLKLQAKEFQVAQQNQRQQQQQQGGQQGQSQGEQQQQRQLNELDLAKNEDRYETQREARAQESAQRREQMQVMNRLKELAQRQQDVNEKLKELQAALSEAKTPEEKEEARRELKRLEEEQRRMLADADELQQRMEQAQNQSEASEQREQLEQARENMQRSAEAAAQGQASQALASGKRAEEQMENIKEQLRKKSAGAFEDDLRQMRADARELARRQEELANELKGGNRPPSSGTNEKPEQTGETRKAAERPTLGGSDEEEKLAQELRKQEERTGELVDRAKELSQQAEPSEPLLSSRIYETVRQFTQSDAGAVKEMQQEMFRERQISEATFEELKQLQEREQAGRALRLASELKEQNRTRDAARVSERARQGMEQLRNGIEQAADSVLGDDTAALRLAEEQLREAAEAMRREVEQRAGKQPQDSNEQAGNSQSGEPREGQSRADAERQGAGEPRPDQDRQMAQNAPRGSSRPGEEESPDSQQPRQSLNGDQPGQASSGRNSERDAPDQQPRQPGTSSEEGERQETAGQPRSPRRAPGQAHEQPGQRGSGQREGTEQEDDGQRQMAGGREPRRQPSAANGGGDGGPQDFDAPRGPIANRRALRDPLTGEGFTPWSDRLREAEELVEETGLRNEIAKARERARQLRLDMRNPGAKPNWGNVELEIVKPLVEVRDRLRQELARRESDKALVPVDRDPVPAQFSENVRRYYEQLGKDQ